MIYEYACIACDHHFDVKHRADEKPELTCPLCQGQVKKVFNVAGIIFKGSGWYVTDSAPKKPDEASEKKTTAPAATESAPAATESAPATPATPATPAPTPATP